MKNIRVDPFSLSTCYLGQFVRTVPNHQLGAATGFLVRIEEQMFLITNWHVVSAMVPGSTTFLPGYPAPPDCLSVKLHATTVPQPGGSQLTWRAHIVDLYDSAGRAQWLEHPVHHSNVDVVALPFAAPDWSIGMPINELPTEPTMAAAVGMDVHVLGFPFGSKLQEFLPTWKKASLASEPTGDYRGMPAFLMDTATRQGMSGAPIIARRWGSFLSVNASGGVDNRIVASATGLLGVYSGRYGQPVQGPQDDLTGMQLGIGWRWSVIEEVVAGRKKGSLTAQ